MVNVPDGAGQPPCKAPVPKYKEPDAGASQQGPALGPKPPPSPTMEPEGPRMRDLAEMFTVPLMVIVEEIVRASKTYAPGFQDCGEEMTKEEGAGATQAPLGAGVVPEGHAARTALQWTSSSNAFMVSVPPCTAVLMAVGGAHCSGSLST